MESFKAIYFDVSKSNVVMLVLKLQGVDLFQRFFLDVGLGFWEEGSEEYVFSAMDDLVMADLTKELEIKGKKVTSIICRGSYETPSSFAFNFQDISVVMKHSNKKDIESEIVLERL